MNQGNAKKEKGARLWYRIVTRCLPWITKYYFKLVAATSRVILLNREYEEEVIRKGSFAVAGFHGTLLYPAYYFRKYGGVIMVSRSWDGDLVDGCLRGWGYDTTRGSSSRDGKEALSGMVNMVRERNCCSGLAVDAPRGPARQVKMGIVVLARETGQPVLPAVSWTSRHIQFGSWDQMILPLPFSTIVVGFGRPVEVPTGLSRESYERLRLEIENCLLTVLEEAESKVRQIKRIDHEIAVKPVPSSSAS